MTQMHLLDDAGEFLTRSCDYVCKQLHLEVAQILYDRIDGKDYRKGFILKNKQGHRYYFVAKRKMHFVENRAEVSIDTVILEESFERKCVTLLLIEDKNAEGGANNYIYSMGPTQIFMDPTTWENEFNYKKMLNFNVKYLVNMEPTRMRGPVEIRIEEQAVKEKNSIRRFIR